MGSLRSGLASLVLLCLVRRDLAFVVGSVDSVCGSSLSATTSQPQEPQNCVPSTQQEIFDDFVLFLQDKQNAIIEQIYSSIEPEARFSSDAWGNHRTGSGGLTRVLKGGLAIEKGACSLTVIRNGCLTAERAATIRARQTTQVQAGDSYSAAALSMVLHSRNPWVPTFRSDVRIFLAGSDLLWLGGGADLTPYYLDRDDVTMFHRMYHDLCQEHEGFNYQELKEACDEYFYLPARKEHRGTGGIFFDDCVATENSVEFVKGVANAWMPSWIPIVQKQNTKLYTKEQKHWQKIRRGRYLEFNLLYDVSLYGIARLSQLSHLFLVLIAAWSEVWLANSQSKSGRSHGVGTS